MTNIFALSFFFFNLNYFHLLCSIYKFFASLFLLMFSVLRTRLGSASQTGTSVLYLVTGWWGFLIQFSWQVLLHMVCLALGVFVFATPAAPKQSLGYAFRCNTGCFIWALRVRACDRVPQAPEETIETGRVAAITLGNRKTGMQKGLQPNPITGLQGRWEQLGLRMSALRAVASVWQWLRHLTPVTCTYALCSAVC